MERITIATPILNGNEKKYVDECIDTGWISANGRFISEFEKKFAEFCGTKYALACCNGTVTLHLALLALGVGPGDEVIMPTLTYIATANAVTYCGATPVFVDSEPDTWNLDVNAFLEKHKILTIYLGVINIVTFFFFAIDKYRAVRNKSRIRIVTLLGMAFAGGTAGALPGIYLLRHKTKKNYFTVGVPLMMVMQVLALFYAMNTGW